MVTPSADAAPSVLDTADTGVAAPHFKCDFEQLPNGTIIWNASRVLLHYLEKPANARALRGRRILELGSGLGHLGYGLARLGAHVTCTERGKIIPELQESIVELERAHGSVADVGGSLRVSELSWGAEEFAVSELGSEMEAADFVPFDVVISAELVYLEETHDLLLWTIERACAPCTVVYSVFINRPFSWAFFAKVHDSGRLEVDQIEDGRDFDPCGLEECHMHRLTRK